MGRLRVSAKLQCGTLHGAGAGRLEGGAMHEQACVRCCSGKCAGRNGTCPLRRQRGCPALCRYRGESRGYGVDGEAMMQLSNFDDYLHASPRFSVVF